MEFKIWYPEFIFDFEIEIRAGELLIFVFLNSDVRETQNFRNLATFTHKIRKEKIYAILRRQESGSTALPYWEKAQKNVSLVSIILGKNDTILGCGDVCF